MSLIRPDTTTLVERVLATSPIARQDDKLLQVMVWEKQGLQLTRDQRIIFLSKRISAPESIRRTRQKLQEAGKYLPPKPVQEARQRLDEETTVEMIQTSLL